MAFLQWRKFFFFDKELVKNQATNEAYAKLKDIHATCTSSGRGHIVIGDSDGSVHCLNRQLMLTSFKAHDVGVTHIQQMRQDPILVTVGIEEIGAQSVVKVWNLEKFDKSGNTLCLRVLNPPNTSKNISSMVVHENMSLMVLGYEDGLVLLVRGDITRERHSKQQLVQVGDDRITGLGLRIVGKHTFLFVATVTNIFSLNVSVKDKESETIIRLDDFGCPEHCSTISDAKHDNHFVVASEKAIYFYQVDGRGPCLVFEGEKTRVHWFKGYLVVVGKNDKPENRSSNMPVTQLDMNVVTLYDIQNKFIAYSVSIPGVLEVMSEWGTLYILTQDGKLFNLQEKDTQSKLDMLFRKNQYSLAISLARSQHYDEEGLADIFRQYGDHLYSKGDHDGAILQFMKTIGKLDASYVIRKFLDAQRIHNLTAYLQALHKKGLATEDHTTLLLNCYTKLKDNTKLDEFVMTKEREVDFDVETAIKVCRQAGYFSHALYLAEKHNQHEWYLKIQIENQKDYKKALEYIGKLDFYEAENNMKKYGKTLICKVPEATTTFLKKLCTDYKPNNVPLVNENMLTGSPPPLPLRARVEEFIHIFVNNFTKLMEFLEYMVQVQDGAPSVLYNTLLELYLQAYKHAVETATKQQLESKTMAMLRNTDARFDIDQALVLCKMNNFTPGILHLYEKAELYQQILSYHIDQNDDENVIQTCDRFGSKDPNLWVQALWFFSNADESQKHNLSRVLSEIEKRKLLPPIMVVDIMSHSSTATLGVIKDYLIKHLQQENDKISNDESLINKYKEETSVMRGQIEELRTSAKIFKVSKCSACNYQLELPSVHFLCGHSYHHQCFESYSAESDQECPLCLPENRKVLDIIRAQEQSAGQKLHDEFHQQLNRAEDGFSIVADYFGRGVFNKVTIITDASTSSKTVPSVRDIPVSKQRDMLLS